MQTLTRIEVRKGSMEDAWVGPPPVILEEDPHIPKPGCDWHATPCSEPAAAYINWSRWEEGERYVELYCKRHFIVAAKLHVVYARRWKRVLNDAGSF